jgi:hypothetical protein
MIPPSARRLIADVLSVNVEAKAYAYGELDGYGVNRSLSFDPATSEWLPQVLELIMEEDPRIRSISKVDANLIVTFTEDHRADQVDRFPIAEVYAVLHD